MDLSVYFITSNKFGYSHEEIALMALKAGIKTIQFREKKMSGKEMLKTAKNLRNLCDNFDATFVVNDRVDIALLGDADGVHVGQDDLPPEEIRRIFDGIVGISVNSVEEAKKAEEHADYLGAGPVFATKTKKDARNVIGIEGLKKIVNAVSIPVVGIGMINSRNVVEVLRTGVAGVAVISGIASAENPELEARKILEAVKKFSKRSPQ